MKYNPFAKKQTVNKILHRYPQPLNMFDRRVGRPEQMGFFDYILGMIPFAVKALLHATKGKSKILHGILSVVSVPLAVVKFILYIATSPLIFVAWVIKELVKKNKSKHKISPFTAVINNLTVTVPALPDQDSDSIPSVRLSEVVKLRNIDCRKFSIKANDQKELVLTRFPSGELVATIEQTRQNIIALLDLADPTSRDRLEYFLANAGRNIIDFSTHALVAEINKQQAVAHVNLMHALLVDATVDDVNAETSFAIIPKDVRKIIASAALADDMVIDDRNKMRFFSSFKPEEREAAMLEFVNKPGAK